MKKQRLKPSNYSEIWKILKNNLQNTTLWYNQVGV